MHEHQDGWCAAGGEMLESMDAECGDGVGKEHYCISKMMVGSLQEVKG